jgi:poly(3-hydroxybutyrate) depolymerase
MKAKKDKGETASIKSMITYAVDECSIDASRIFITGMSAGEGMSKVLLNAYPETFNAEALLAAPPSLPGGLSDTSRTVPRALITQGDEDKVVTPAMGEKVLVQWLTKNELDSLNRETTANFMENELLRTRSYSRDQE